MPGPARRDVFTRSFPGKARWLRFGLPGHNAARFAATFFGAAREA
ncbi:MAG: hypothetical protein AAF318_08045 [Pseudomonadota bacterium]